MQKKTLLLSSLALLGLAFQSTLTVQAADYPTKAIELIVPVGAGGGTDLSARTFAKHAQKLLGKPVVIVNINGAAGYNGSRTVREDKSDGYKVLYTHQGLITTYLTKVAPYSYDAFKPGPMIAEDPSMGLFVSSKSGIKTIQDLITKTKAEPGRLKAATEFGGVTYFMLLKLQQEQKIKFNMIDVGGDSAKVTALLSGFVDLMPRVYFGAQDYIKSGDFVLLGQASATRANNAAEVPTYKEQGVDFTFPAYKWSLFFSENTPQEVINRWDEVARTVTASPAFQKDMQKLGILPAYHTPEQAKAAYGEIQTLFTELSADDAKK